MPTVKPTVTSTKMSTQTHSSVKLNPTTRFTLPATTVVPTTAAYAVPTTSARSTPTATTPTRSILGETTLTTVIQDSTHPQINNTVITTN